MAKNQEEYIPQFDYSDFDETSAEKPKRQKCLSCGNYSASLVDGVCFACRNKLDLYTYKTTVQEPNVNLHLDWCEQHSFEVAHRLPIGFVFYPLLKHGIGATIWFIVSLNFFIYALMGLIHATDTAEAIVALVVFGIPAIVFTIISICLAKGIKEKRIKRFNKFNSQKVQLMPSDSWICPCCHRINENISFCKDCGVFPQLYK